MSRQPALQSTSLLYVLVGVAIAISILVPKHIPLLASWYRNKPILSIAGREFRQVHGASRPLPIPQLHSNTPHNHSVHGKSSGQARQIIDSIGQNGGTMGFSIMLYDDVN